MDYEISSSIIEGPTVGCYGKPTIVPGATVDEATNPQFEEGGVFAAAVFHTHTPLTYCSSHLDRDVGPSDNNGQGDIDFANSKNIPGAVMDYSTTIQGGHDIDQNSEVYTFGPNRRTYF